MQVLVDEEYGFTHWLWKPEVEGEDELSQHFQRIVANPEAKFFVDENYKKRLGGTWTGIDYEKRQEIIDSDEFDVYAHLHEPDDSYLVFRT